MALPLERSWLVLVHQLPPEPPGVRVRIWRRLQALGALQLKSSVYLLPDSEESREDFDWLLGEIEAAGADATILRSVLVAGISDETCIERFRAAATTEFDELRSELRELRAASRPTRRRPDAPDDLPRQVARARGRLAAIERRDYFGADGREAVDALLAELTDRVEGTVPPTSDFETTAAETLRGRTWVTRAGVKIDRTASAWLVRRFVDPDATFRFVAGRHHPPAPDSVRFDMPGGEFTHEGDACTFETLVARLGLRAPGLAKLAEIVHDLDLKEERFGHPETAGIAAWIGGLVATTADDLARIEKALPLFDGLLAKFAQER